jgi:hypothetical protein
LFLNDESPGDEVAQEVGDAHQQLREEVGRVAGVAQLGLEVTQLLDLLAQGPDHRRQTLAPFLTKKILVVVCRVADPNHLNSDTDSACHFIEVPNSNSDPAFHFNMD